MNFFHHISNSFPAVTPGGIVTTNLVWHIDPRNTASYPGSGTTIYDLVGTKNGTFVGNTYVDANKHLRFDGVSDYISFGTIATTDALALIGTSYTINIWFYYVGTGDNYPHPFSMWRTTSQATQDGFFVGVERTTRRVFSGHVNVTQTSCATASPNLTTLNTWEYWSFNYDFATGGATAYKNGVVFATATGMNTITNTAKLFRVGASNYDTFSDWNGRLGSFHVYNRVLSQAEILQNFNATKSGYGL